MLRDLRPTDPDLVSELVGGPDLLAWFGRTHSFHDAEVKELSLRAGDEGVIVLDAYWITERTDPEGIFVTDRHVEVTLRLRRIRSVTLESDHGGSAIVSTLEIYREADALAVEWDTSYGPGGRITAGDVALSLKPGDHRRPRPTA